MRRLYDDAPLDSNLIVEEPRVLSYANEAHRILIDALKLFVSTSSFLSLNAAIVAAFSFLLYGIAVQPAILAISFLATFSVYNMNRTTDVAEDSINRSEAPFKGTVLNLVSSIVSLVLCFILSFWVGLKTVSVIAVSFIASIAYSVKLMPSFPRLKEIVGLKSIIVAFSWGFTGAFLPATTHPVDSIERLLVFAYLFIQLFVNTVLCDVRDMHGDRASGIITLPIALGLNKVRILLLAVNSLLLPLIFYCVVHGYFLVYLPALLFGVAYGYFIILVFSIGKRNRLLVDLAVDGEWMPLLAIMKML